MKLKYSLFTRRQLLDGLIGGWLAALAVSFLYPILRFVFRPTPEPDQVVLPLAEFAGMERGTVRRFAWGGKPGFLRKKEAGGYMALVGVCTHLDCNVAWRADKNRFFCACHEGWYDADGVNVAGPPPRRLRRLQVSETGDKLVIKPEAAA
jgi:ubiquinol-cytochrome c reductase iron-sulfur subunit